MTLIDPVGQGGNLIDFMRLPQLIRGEKIFSSRQDIERELEGLSQHIENVIQTRLINTYRLIEEYNNSVGEITVPYHFLIAANLPAGFSDTALARLEDIARNGPRVGTFFLATVDPMQNWPHGHSLNALANLTTVVTEGDGRECTWNDPVFGGIAITPDAPPPKDIINAILDTVGPVAIEEKNRGLTFDRVRVPEAKYWNEKSVDGLCVPVGVNEEGKIQLLELGVGLVQHGLIGGKTASGKTNLIHLLLLGMAETYPPAELEFYLVDFKEGVEFKDYETYDLPHARVVALESERELGLSVLRRLQEEMTRRGDLFRPVGVKAIDEYRKQTGKPLSRILLVIDEYQVLFTPDTDTIAAEANNVLTDLVKRGRAFGIHVLLSSQSPASAFTNNRQALSQIALRISFQAEDSVARQILAADNDAARLLERPGEAIFNTGNGLPKNNIFVQVALLPHEEQRRHLTKLAELARTRGVARSEPLIVFEGDAPVRLIQSRHFHERLAETDWSHDRTPGNAWLGEAIEIKPHTRVAFERRPHANLLVVGQDKKRGYSLLANALLSLVVCTSPRQAEFYILDLSRRDEPWGAILSEVTAALPHSREMVDSKVEATAMLTRLRDLLDARSTDAAAAMTMPDIYWLIAGLTQFSALSERDKFDNPGPGAKDFIRICSEGPELGIHTLAWVPSYDQLDRMIRRPGTSQFGLRVALPMTADESNRFLDKPDASRLGPKLRAVLRDDASGSDDLEKFKPYDLPTVADVNQIRVALQRRMSN
ncbi:MAG: FtsK/SpoIIIE domain-containing protein [Thermodesulfobacteriota bacterium]